MLRLFGPSTRYCDGIHLPVVPANWGVFLRGVSVRHGRSASLAFAEAQSQPAGGRRGRRLHHQLARLLLGRGGASNNACGTSRPTRRWRPVSEVSGPCCHQRGRRIQIECFPRLAGTRQWTWCVAIRSRHRDLRDRHRERWSRPPACHRLASYVSLSSIGGRPSIGAVVLKPRAERSFAVPHLRRFWLPRRRIAPGPDSGQSGLPGGLRPRCSLSSRRPRHGQALVLNGITTDRLDDRVCLLRGFDQMRRDVDSTRPPVGHRCPSVNGRLGVLDRAASSTRAPRHLQGPLRVHRERLR